MNTTATDPESDCRVIVKFGDTPIRSWRCVARDADLYVRFAKTQFRGLEVVVEKATPDNDDSDRPIKPLPEPRAWGVPRLI